MYAYIVPHDSVQMASTDPNEKIVVKERQEEIRQRLRSAFQNLALAQPMTETQPDAFFKIRRWLRQLQVLTKI